MSAEDATPCQAYPEAWVTDDDRVRAEAAKECAKCPLKMFEACQKLAKVEPFGVMAGRDYGTTIKSAARIAAQLNAPDLAEDVKECEQCGITIRRGNASKGDWDKRRYCTRKCYGSTKAIQGLPETKSCQQCGAEYGRKGRSPRDWMSSMFCGVDCAGAARRKEKAA